MKKNCEEISKLITDKLAGELTPEQEQFLEEHLKTCESCRKDLEELQKIWSMVRQTLKEEPLPETLETEQYDKIFKALKEPKQKKNILFMNIKFHWLELVACVVIMIVLAGMLLPALNSAREKARRISCASDMKPIEIKADISDWEDADGCEEGISAGGASKETSCVEPAIAEAEIKELEKIPEPPAPPDEVVEEIEVEVDSSDIAGEEEDVSVEPGFLNVKSNKSALKLPAVYASRSSGARKSAMKTYSCAPQKEPALKRKEEAVREDNLTFIDGHVTGETETKERGYKHNEIFSQKQLKDSIGDECDADYNAKGTASSLESSDKKIRTKKIVPNKTESFHLNLKLWDLTSVRDVKRFFMRNRIELDNVGDIFIDKDKNVLKITAPVSVLKKIDGAIDKLKKEEERLNERKNGLPFIKTQNKPVSTFSIDVDTASYTAARKKIRQGQRPEPASVRPEEFINYFDYHYRSPRNSTFGVYLEAARSPVRSGNYLFRIGVQGKKLGPGKKRMSSFTVLVDTSGSMASKDRLSLVKKSLKMLIQQLRGTDKISIITCGNNAKMLVSGVSVSRLDFLNNAISRIKASGATNLEKGIIAAYNTAIRNYQPGGYNRVIVFSDGIVETDSGNAEMILKKVEDARNKGVGNTIIAVGGDGDDNLMEALADKGDGSYIFLDSEEEAEELFNNQFAARFRVIAKDVKIQVEFNPDAVESYRQVGYDNRQLSRADFRNDKVDAGEVGAGQSVTALYDLRLKPEFREKGAFIATVRIRYKNMPSLEVEEKEYYLEPSDIKNTFEKAGDNFKLAFAAGEFAENLKYPDVPGIANPSYLKDVLNKLLHATYKSDRKVHELYEIVNSVK
jgi:Ca-activated chloride channel family protein